MARSLKRVLATGSSVTILVAFFQNCTGDSGFFATPAAPLNQAIAMPYRSGESAPADQFSGLNCRAGQGGPGTAGHPLVPGEFLFYLLEGREVISLQRSGAIGTEIEFLVGDLNGDRMADLLGRSTITGKLALYLGAFGKVRHLEKNLGSIGMEHQLALVDFTGDGKADLFARDTRTGALGYYASSGDELVYSHRAGAIGANVELHFADLNGDGRQDMMGRDRYTGTVNVHLSNGREFVYEGMPAGIVDPAWEVYLADVDGNRQAEIVARRRDNGFLALFSYANNSLALLRINNGIGVEHELHFADLNGDLKTDLVARRKTDGRMGLYHSDGAHFNLVDVSCGIGLEWKLSFVDNNGDGKSDIVSRFLPHGYRRDLAPIPWK